MPEQQVLCPNFATLNSKRFPKEPSINVPADFNIGSVDVALAPNQTGDGTVRPFQTPGRIAAVDDQVAQVAVTVPEVDLIHGCGWVFGGQFLVDRKGLAVLRLRFRAPAETGE